MHNEYVKTNKYNKKNLCKNKHKILPVNLKFIVKVRQALNIINIKIKQKQHFLLLNNNNENIIIFLCYTNFH